MSEERNGNTPEIDKEVLQQMELKRMKIITHISDLPPSKKERVIKSLDELITMAINPFCGVKERRHNHLSVK